MVKFEMITKLPRKGNSKTSAYDWDKIIGTKITIKYEDIIYDLIIHKKEKRNLFVSPYDDVNNIININDTNFFSGHVGNILGKINHKYVYNVGDIIKTKTGKIEILEQIKIGKSNVKGYKYQCMIDNNIDTIDEDGLYNRKQGCNVCSNHKIIKGINDITTTHPHLVKYFKNIEDAYRYSFGSGKKALMKCPDCGFEKYMKISDLSTYEYFSCPKCGDKISIPQKTMFNVLEQLNINFETEKVFDWCKYVFKNKLKQGRYDFYFKLNNKEYVVETDGDWHKKDNNKSGQTKEESKFIDDEKDRLAEEHNIEVIRIDCELSDLEYIKNNILDNKDLKYLFDLNKINWLEVLNFVKSSRIIEACNYYNDSLSYDKITNKMKISNITLIKHLKIGSKLNLCGYKTQYELGQEHFVQAIDLWNSGIKSTVEIGNKLNMHYTSIINILKKGKEQNLCDYVPVLGYQEKYKINN